VGLLLRVAERVFGNRANPVTSVAAILSDLEISIDRHDRALRAVHTDGDILKAKLCGAKQVLDRVDFL